MLFLEYDLYDVGSHFEDRLERFWAAFPEETAYYPICIVDSGNQWYSGPNDDLVSIFGQMVEQSLKRPPKADLSAYWWQQGEDAWFYVQMTNRSEETLSASNDATVHAVAYEIPTGAPGHRWARYVQDSPVGVLTPLAAGATETQVLETKPIGADWSRMDGAVILDYKTSTFGAYDTLQAAIATRLDAPLSASQTEVLFLVDLDDATLPSARIQFSGIPGLTWHAQADQPWITMNRASGDLSQACALSVSKGELAEGWQEATVTFGAEADEHEFSQSVTVRVYAGDVSRTHMPLLAR